ncbi:hypothetical protein R2601_10279 [Salipiger bermudensis HTCC2601]|uniref:Uncharacterized protein n=1 Tax=Salipiger bermudensis (strain DSM 26914 / JCM 13377 / KCTC 12554 / HTCC2601) TaxID=314265 RepID=Q0FLY9_SALBH|nr:hypothetical protein R2601_10279 [Salipiger bermudensis HTCC2601]
MPSVQRLEKTADLFTPPDIPTLEFWKGHVAFVDIFEN